MNANFGIEGTGHFWLNSDMAESNEQQLPNTAQVITLNEKVILSAREIKRRRDELLAQTTGEIKSDLVFFQFESFDQAMLVERLFMEIYELVSPDKFQIHQFFKIRLDSYANTALVIIDYIDKNYNARCQEHISKTDLLGMRVKVDELKQGAAVPFAEWVLPTGLDIWVKFNQKHLAMLEILDRAVSLSTLCGFRQSIIPVIQQSSAHKSVIDYVLFKRLKHKPSLIEEIQSRFSGQKHVSILNRSPVERDGYLVMIPFEILPLGWMVNFSRIFADVVNPESHHSLHPSDIPLVFKYYELFHGAVQVNRYVHSVFTNDPGFYVQFIEQTKNLILAQADFCKRIRDLILGIQTAPSKEPVIQIPAPMPPSPSQTWDEDLKKDVEEIKEKLETVLDENRREREKVITVLDDLTEVHINLKVENEKFRLMTGKGLFDFVEAVEPEDFRACVYILAYGTRAKACQELQVPLRRFYERVDGWRLRGAAYRRMYGLVQCRKKLMNKGTVPLGEKVQSGDGDENPENPQTMESVLRACSRLEKKVYPTVLQDILGALANMNPKNWEAIKKELTEVIENENAQ